MVDLTTDVPLEYRNRLANEVITISSLLDGFSIAIIANILVSYRSHLEMLLGTTKAIVALIDKEIL